MKMKPFPSRFAFTLLELVVVIGIIVLLAGFLGRVLWGGDSMAGLHSGERIAAGMIQAARAEAILKNSTARCIVHNDSRDKEKFHRYVGVVYLNPPDRQWYAANAGTYLPEGVYFFEAGNSSLSSGTLAESKKMDLEFPRRDGQLVGEKGEGWIYYEFNGSGISMDAGRTFTVALARATGPEGELVFKKGARGGFVIHKLGGISMLSFPPEE